MSIAKTQLIDSRNDVRIRRIRRLHSRAERERTGRYYIEGMRFVAQAFARRVPIKTVVVCPSLLTHPFARRLARRLHQAGVPTLEVTPPVLHSLALVDDPQGIAAVVAQRWLLLERVQPRNELCWIALDSVHSPGNLGTILRTAEAAAVSGVWLTPDSVDLYNPKVVRAAMGAHFRLPAWPDRAWPAIRADLARLGIAQVVALDAGAATAYDALDWREPAALVVGSEAHGLSPAARAAATVRAAIPMPGQAESLNAGIATAVVLFEALRQRRAG